VTLPKLTPREIAVLTLMAGGVRTKGIAAILGVSIKTVESTKTKLFSKIGANNAAIAFRWAMRTGYI
jgi:DNA-binding CsgD family transcriptional regulator